MDSLETLMNVLNMIEDGVDKTEIAEKCGVSVRFVENLIEANNKNNVVEKDSNKDINWMFESYDDCRLILQELSEKIDDIIPYIKIIANILYRRAMIDTCLLIGDKAISNAFFCISKMLAKNCDELGTVSETAKRIVKYLLNTDITTDKYKERCDKNDGSQA